MTESSFWAMNSLNAKCSHRLLQLVILFCTNCVLFSQSNKIYVFFPDNTKGNTIENCFWSIKIVSSNDIDSGNTPHTKTIYMWPSLHPNKFSFKKNDEVRAEILATFEAIGLKNFSYPKTSADHEWGRFINGIELAIITSGYSINHREVKREVYDPKPTYIFNSSPYEYKVHEAKVKNGDFGKTVSIGWYFSK